MQPRGRLGAVLHRHTVAELHNFTNGPINLEVTGFQPTTLESVPPSILEAIWPSQAVFAVSHPATDGYDGGESSDLDDGDNVSSEDDAAKQTLSAQECIDCVDNEYFEDEEEQLSDNQGET
jgi:hypothetical protein